MPKVLNPFMFNNHTIGTCSDLTKKLKEDGDQEYCHVKSQIATVRPSKTRLKIG